MGGLRSARRLDGGKSGISSLFELHETSLLSTFAADGFKKQTQPAEKTAGVDVFSDVRSGTAGLKVADLCKTEAESEDEGDKGSRGSKALEALHGMFDQVDHSKLLRSDSQELLMLNSQVITVFKSKLSKLEIISRIGITSHYK